MQTTFSAPRNRQERRALDAGHVVAFPINESNDRLGISRTTAYEEIKAGRLKAVKCGARTLIPMSSALAWLDSLPPLPQRTA
jgi:excisionase family DNA binding protein